jgi:hypothetical protein
MSHALTNRQREYQEFIREFIMENESSPRLEEIAEHFNVTSPTANKILKALQEKGCLYFDRDKVSGFYIRVPEKHVPTHGLREIPITGIVGKYGEVLRFPQYHGHIPDILPEGVNGVFAFVVYKHNPPAGMLGNDHIIFSTSGVAKPGDICIYPFGKRIFLVRMYEFGPHEDMPFYELSIKWLEAEEQYKNHMFWWPLIDNEDEEANNYFAEIVSEHNLLWYPIKPDGVIGKVVRLKRRMAI